MKNIFDHIEQVKGKPHHVRKRIAFTIATLGSALVAFVWLAGSFATNAFVIQGSSFAMSTGQEGTVATTSASGDQLAGVGAAAILKDAYAPAHIEIVDTTPPVKKQSEQTTLPF